MAERTPAQSLQDIAEILLVMQGGIPHQLDDRLAQLTPPDYHEELQDIYGVLASMDTSLGRIANALEAGAPWKVELVDR
jgi:hypothetical protein